MNDKPLPDDLEELLPWYVLGTLSEAETDQVAAALAARADGSRLVEAEVALSQRLAEAPSQLDEVLGRRPQAYEFLRAAVARAPVPTPDQSANRRHAGTAWWISAASMFVIAASASIGLWSAGVRYTGEYATLTNAETASSAVIVQVAAAAGVMPQQVGELAKHLHASIVSGPSPRNVYRFALPVRSEPVADLAWLRHQPEVAFATVERR